MTTHAGAPALIDLSTSDTGAAAAFYRDLFGWEVDPENPSGYRYARQGQRIVSGLRGAEPDAPAAWTVYLATADIGETARSITDLGGTVVHGPVPVPEQGSVLIAVDPSGNVTGYWQPETSWDFAADTVGAFAWAELLAPDGKVTDDHYAGVLGIEATQIGDGDGYDYAVWTPSGDDRARLGRHRAGEAAGWTVYFAVDPAVGTDDIAERAVRLGATVTTEPTDIPAGRIAILADPTGARFGLLDPSRRS